jgi:hypothetical protein
MLIASTIAAKRVINPSAVTQRPDPEDLQGWLRLLGESDQKDRGDAEAGRQGRRHGQGSGDCPLDSSALS